MNEKSLALHERPVAAVIRQLRECFGDRCTIGQAVRDQHGKDVSFHPLHAPDAVVFAESTEEVATVARLCHAASVPMIPFGTGTSCEGGVAALHGGICIDLSRMNAVLEIHEADFDCRVQAGVTRKQLNAALHGSGLHFPIDPGADASIGGMVSTRASGTNAVRYGTMRESVMSLEVVLPDGEVVRTGGRARKSAAGYDLTHLFTGAEGTLGIVTEVGLRLHPLPEQIAAARCAFPHLRAAIDAVTAIMQTGVPVCRWAASSSSMRSRSRPATATRNSGCRSCPRCSSNSTVRPKAWHSRCAWPRNSQARMAALDSRGPTRPRSAAASGRHATTCGGQR